MFNPTPGFAIFRSITTTRLSIPSSLSLISAYLSTPGSPDRLRSVPTSSCKPKSDQSQDSMRSTWAAIEKRKMAVHSGVPLFARLAMSCVPRPGASRGARLNRSFCCSRNRRFAGLPCSRILTLRLIAADPLRGLD